MRKLIIGLVLGLVVATTGAQANSTLSATIGAQVNSTLSANEADMKVIEKRQDSWNWSQSTKLRSLQASAAILFVQSTPSPAIALLDVLISPEFPEELRPELAEYIESCVRAETLIRMASQRLYSTQTLETHQVHVENILRYEVAYDTCAGIANDFVAEFLQYGK